MFLEAERGALVEDTGWKHGFGLEVAVGVPVRLEGLEAELETVGSEIVFKRSSGSARSFDDLCAAIRNLTFRS